MTIKDMKPVVVHDEDTKFSSSHALPHEVFETKRNSSVITNAGKHWRVILTSCAGFTSAGIVGYDIVVNGASISMPAFLLAFGEIGPAGLYLPSIWASLWNAMSSLTQAVGALICGWLIDKLGRKWPASAAASLTLVGTAVQYTASSRGSLMAGKMVSGLGIGAVMAVATTYVSEISPLKLRAPLQTVLILLIIFIQGAALGIIRSFVPNTQEVAFRRVFAIQWVVGGIAAIAWALAPESPVFLAKSGKLEDARKAMTRIYGQQNFPNERLKEIIKTIDDEKQSEQGSTYIGCLKVHDLKRTLTVAFLYSIPNLGGAAFLNQNIYVLITAGLPPVHAFDVGIGGFGLAVLIVCFSGIYLKRLTRRTVVLIGLVMNLLGMVIIAALYWVPGQGSLWAMAVLMNLLITIQTSTLQGAGWPIAAEISSYRFRAKTLSIGVFAQTLTTWIFLFITPYMCNVDSGDLGARTGFVYGGITVILLCGAWILIPNTTGMSIEEIDHAYETFVSPRKFRQGKT